MYSYLKGIVKEKKPQYIILESNDVGFKILIPLSTYYKLPEAGVKLKIFVENFLKEERPVLFGFLTEKERDIFLELIKVPGIGTKTALALLSEPNLNTLIQNIVNHNIKEITKIPGIGKKSAERLCYELKEKFSKKFLEGVGGEIKEKEVWEDLTSALINLGYSKKNVEKVVEKILTKEKNLKIEELIRKALTMLSGI